jgi:hypothetical protein
MYDKNLPFSYSSSSELMSSKNFSFSSMSSPSHESEDLEGLWVSSGS